MAAPSGEVPQVLEKNNCKLAFPASPRKSLREKTLLDDAMELLAARIETILRDSFDFHMCAIPNTLSPLDYGESIIQ